MHPSFSEPLCARVLARLAQCSLNADQLIHLVVSIPPSLSIANVVKRIKGSSSRHINKTFPQQTFAWQNEYGVFSLGGKQLEMAIAYVNKQKEHHKNKSLIHGLEPDTLFKKTPKPPQ